jgi:anti-sigma regulatory factor (Ser/Thr protein kinase)
MLVRRQFEPVASSVRGARQFARDALSELATPVVDDALLVVSELVTNAVQHAGTRFEVAIDVPKVAIDGTSTLRIAVTDGNAQRPELLHPGPHEPSGRGMALVDALGDWGIEPTSVGKRVWWESPIDLT